MNAGTLVAVVLIPILCGALIPLIPFKSRTQMAVYVEMCCADKALCWF